MKIWYLLCGFFFLLCIINLNEDSNYIVYKKVYQDEEPIYRLVCFDSKKKINILYKKSTIDLNQLKEIVYNHSIKYRNNYCSKSNWSTKSKDVKEFNELILNQIESKDYFILRGLLCFAFKKLDILSLRKLHKNRFINSFFENEKYFIFKESTLSIFKLDHYYAVDQLVVKNYDNCTKDYSKLECLNKCYTKKNRLSKYFYNGNESGIVYLKYKYNQTIKKYEDHCFKSECQKNDCKLINFEAAKDSSKDSLSVFESFFFLLRSDYYIQFLGLICLIENVSFYQLLSKLIEFIRPKIKKIKKIKIRKKVIRITNHDRYLFIFKIIILLICAHYFLLYSFGKIEKFNLDVKNPAVYEAKIYQLDLKTVNLVICVSVVKILENEYEKKNLNSSINKTFFDLERATDKGFTDTIEEIYLEFMNKRSKIEWILISKVLFRKRLRCFQIEAYVNEPKYQSLLATSKLILRFKHDKYELYLLSENEDFNSESYYYASNGKFLKIKRSNKNDNCVDYHQKYLDCKSKQNCIDRCVNTKFMKNYNSISIYSIIDKQHFTKDQWTSLFYNENQTKYDEIKKKCEKEFRNNDCYEIKFKRYSFIFLNPLKKEINLYYDVIESTQEEYSFYKLLIDLLNMQSIIFGQNVLKLLLTFYCFLNTKCQLKGSKYYLFFVYFICLIGFIYHTFFLFNELLNGELIFYAYYRIENTIKMPEIILCFDLKNNEIDRNYRLTENYLNQINKEIRIDTVFEKIEYLNQSYEWVYLESNFTNSKFKIETLYFLDKKCFKIKHNIKYDRDQFYSLENKEVLKVNFNRYLIGQTKETILYSFTKIENKMDFSKVDYLGVFYKKPFKSYIMSQESTELIKNGKLDLIKNSFLRLFYNDANDINKELAHSINNFEQDYNSTSTYFLSEKRNSKKEINDDLFDQYYKQIYDVKYNSSVDTSIQKLFIKNNYKLFPLRKFKPDFIFELNFLKNVVKYEFNISFSKIILNILTILSLWFNLCILDLHIYVYYAYSIIPFSFIFAHKLLTRIKNLFKSLIIVNC